MAKEKKQRVFSPGRSRRKGHQFERECAILFRDIFPGARRHLEYQDSQANGVDLAETGDLRIQCKKLKTYASINTIHEVQCEPALGEIPILVTAGDGLPAMAVLSFSDLINLLKRIPRGCL